MVATQITLVPTPPLDDFTLSELSDPNVDDNNDGDEDGHTGEKRAAGKRGSVRLAKKAKADD